MKKTWKIILITLGVAAVAAYLVFAAVYYPQRNAERRCEAVEIAIADSAQIRFLTRADIAEQLRRAQLNPTGKPMESVSLRAMEQAIIEIPFVKRAECTKTQGAVVNIKVWQRRPLFRVIAGARQFYVDDEGGTMPIAYERGKRAAALPMASYVPVVTGVADEKFLTKNVYEFIVFLNTNPFWDALVEQIHILPNKELELTLRLGDTPVLLGGLEDYEEKLSRLKMFLEQGLDRVSWTQYSQVSLKYKKQVICTRKETKPNNNIP